MSAWWSGLRRSARIPPCTFGWRVTTRCPRMAGNPVSSATSVTARLASRSAAAVPPLETRSQPRLRSSRASSTTPDLSYTDSSALMSGDGLLQDGGVGEDGADGGGVQPALDLLDALVEGRLVVTREDRDGLLGED